MNNKQNPVILFDMDGTLTPARQKIENDMVIELVKLTSDFNIGIVSGSPIEYIIEQLKGLWAHVSPADCEVIKILPCNGTQVWTKESVMHPLEKQYFVSMEEQIGKQRYKDLVLTCMLALSKCHKEYDLPLTGHFVSCRGSTVNISPIGRSATPEEREIFVAKDKKFNIRKQLLTYMKESEIDNCLVDIVMSLGGNTSLDIFPAGWDKTYALRHYTDYDRDKIFFVGDKCKPGENDYELFVELGDKAYETSGPEQTVEIMKNIKMEYLLNEYKEKLQNYCV